MSEQGPTRRTVLRGTALGILGATTASAAGTAAGGIAASPC